MPELKTKLTRASVDDFLDAIANEQVRDDCRTIAAHHGEGDEGTGPHVGREHRRIRQPSV